MPPRLLAPALLLAGLCSAASVFAQAKEAKQHSEEVAGSAPSNDTVSLAASLGGSGNTGNTQNWQLHTGGDFLLVRRPSAVTANVKFAYGQANPVEEGGPPDDTFEDTVKNLNAKMRYDFFLSDHDALFVAAIFRWDEYAGLDARAQGQLGYLRIFHQAQKRRFWGEVGYDITYDNFHPDPLPNPDFDIAMPQGAGNLPSLPLSEGEQVVHSARGFVGYDNQLSQALTYVGGVEGLLNVEDRDDFRVNVDNALRSSLHGALKLELKFTLQFDNVPAPGARSELDTATVISLIYTLL